MSESDGKEAQRVEPPAQRGGDGGGDAAETTEEEQRGFEEIGLDPRLVRALSKKGVEKPTPIQQVAIPLILVSPPSPNTPLSRRSRGLPGHCPFCLNVDLTRVFFLFLLAVIGG